MIKQFINLIIIYIYYFIYYIHDYYIYLYISTIGRKMVVYSLDP